MKLSKTFVLITGMAFGCAGGVRLMTYELESALSGIDPYNGPAIGAGDQLGYETHVAFEIQEAAGEDLRPLIEAMWFVESSCQEGEIWGDLDATYPSFGPLQISEAYFRDAIEFNPHLQHYTWMDCSSLEVSVEITLAYWDRYATEKRLGRQPTFEDRARIHVGGPNGYKRSSSLDYWGRILNRLRSQNGGE